MIKLSSKGLDLLQKYEGYSEKVYKCPAGFNTIGYGHNCDANPLTPYQKSCFESAPENAAESLLISDLEKFEKAIQQKKPFVEDFCQARVDALVDMTFNMGEGWMDSWPNTWKMIQNKDWKGAADSIRSSKYAKQVGHRARNNAHQIETGEYA